MARADVLIVTAAGTTAAVRSAIEAIEGVTETHVVAELETAVVSSMLPIVTEEIHGLDGVGHTRTCVVLGSGQSASSASPPPAAIASADRRTRSR